MQPHDSTFSPILLQRFREITPEATWAVLGFALTPRDNPFLAHRFTTSALEEAMSQIGEGVLARDGSYCIFGDTMLAGFAHHRPGTDYLARQELERFLAEPAKGSPALGSVLQALAPFVSIATMGASGLIGPGALLGNLQPVAPPLALPAAHAQSSAFGATQLPGAHDIQNELAKPLRIDKIFRKDARPLSAAPGVISLTHQLSQLLEEFVSERGASNHPWSEDLKHRAEAVDALLAAQLRTCPPSQIGRVRSMLQFADAIKEIVEEPRVVVNAGRHQGRFRYAHHPAFANAMLIHEGAAGQLSFHDPAKFDDPQSLDGENVEVMYAENGDVADIDHNPIERTRDLGREF